MSEEMQDFERLATNLRVESELLEALEVLRGVRVVVFKGPTLTRMIFGDLRRRASGDNDLWIRRAEVEGALEQMLKAGYLPMKGLDARRAMTRYGQVALWPNGDFRRVSIDLHVEPFSGRYFRVEETVLEENLQDTEVQGVTLKTFNPVLALTHLVAHFVQHHFAEKQLLDFCHAWNSLRVEVNESVLFELAGKTCTKSALSYSFGVAQAARPGLELPTVQDAVARLVSLLGGDRPWEAHALGRKFLSLLLVGPEKVPRGAYKSVFLDQDDLHSRYGEGNRVALLTRHLRTLLQR